MTKKTPALMILASAMLAFNLTNSAWGQTETVIYSFPGGSDGSMPQGGVVADAKGNLYGTTEVGGAGSGGVVFELTPNGDGTWAEQVIYSFNFTDGGLPYSGLIADSHGNLYGETEAGGTFGFGTVYELSPGSNGTWTQKVIYSFAGGTDAGSPLEENLAFDSKGNLYGATAYFGAYSDGAVFELTLNSDGDWNEEVLYSFSGGNDGAYPNQEQLVIDAADNVYGFAVNGGMHDYGVVFELVRGADSWTEKVLHAFTGGTDGAPQGGMTLDASGNLYGASSYAVFELTPGADGTWAEKELHRFTGGSDGAYPQSKLIFDKAGNMYGTTLTGGAHRGTVFELSPGSGGIWTENILHKFSATGGDGIFPGYAGLARDAKGNLYGTTFEGGTSNYGAVFAVKP
jgi:uncharacterized repeat protein (TIGR03803 family)